MPARTTRTRDIVLVTGASQGIGEAIALAFARERIGGLALVARQEDKLRTVAAACRKAGAPAAEVFPCDCADADAVAGMAAAVHRRFKRVDVLVNNAGKYFGAPFLETPVAEFDRMYALNLRSLVLVAQAFAPGMVARGRGDIFNMGSVASITPLRNAAAYCAAKFGVLGLTRVMRQEFKDKGVRVACVEPGATASPSWDGSGVPPGRMMPAEDVAAAFVSLWRMDRRTVVEEIVLRPQLGDL